MRPGACTLALALSTAAVLTLPLGTNVLAQAPPAGAGAPLAPAAPKGPAPKAAPKAATPQQKAAEPQQQAGGPAQPQLLWSPWVKLCPPKGPEENAPQVCVTGRDGRDEAGFPIVATQIIENQTAQQKLLRITLPLGMLLQQPMRIQVDNGQPLNAPYVICFANGCMADFESSAEFIGQMKKGQALLVGGVHAQLGPVQLKVPLTEFGKVNDAPATDLKVYEEQQRKLQEDLQKRAEEYRKKIESQGQQPSAAVR
jgi:invasion protein IalB